MWGKVMTLQNVALFGLISVATGWSVAGAPNTTRLADVVFHGTNERFVFGLSILRSNPTVVGRLLRVTPKRIGNSYSVKIEVTHEDLALIESVLRAMRETDVTRGCAGYPLSVADFPVAWAVILYDIDGNEVGSVYLSKDGRCAAVQDALYAVDKSFVSFLRSRFTFMTFDDSQQPKLYLQDRAQNHGESRSPTTEKISKRSIA
jgi:hypothetical protein